MTISKSDAEQLNKEFVNALASGNSSELDNVGRHLVEVLDDNPHGFTHRHRVSDTGAIVIDAEAPKEMKEYLKAAERLS